MKKEILPQYVYRDKMGNSAALKEYYSLKFDNIDSCYEYIWKNILLQEAILLCNRTLFMELSNFYKKSEKNKRRLLRTLENYFIRFCTRPSTFFTFGYVGVGEFSHGAIEENLKCDSKSVEKITDISTEWAFDFLKLILRERDVLKELFVFLNPNLIGVGTKLLNQKLYFCQSDIQKIFLTDLNIVLSDIIETCKTPLKISSLVNLLLEKGFELNTIYDYIQQLIDCEILFFECFEILTRDNKINLIDDFINRIELIPAKFKRQIACIKSKIELYNSIPLGEGSRILMDLYSIMDDICKVNTPLNILCISHQRFQMDYQIKNEIEEFLNILLTINLKYKQERSLKEYTRKFYNLYGSNNLVPLTELLSVKGLGSPSNYSNPILSTYLGETLNINDGTDKFQHDLVNQILNTTSGEEIKLENLIEQGRVVKDSFPTAEVVFSIYEVDNRIKLRWNGNQYSDNFFSISGKYVSYFKENLNIHNMLEIERKFYNELLIGVDEFYNNLVLNDIKRENALDNLILDFPFFKNIDISDVYVYLDNKNNFQVFSKKIGTNMSVVKRNRISPDLLNNQTRFLYSIFCNQLSYYDFYKVFSIEYLHYQNRIVYKDIIVYPETWRLSKNSNFDKFIKNYNVPKFVNLVEGDMELLINLDKKGDIEKVKQKLKTDKVVLTEYLGELKSSNEIIAFSKNIDNSTQCLEKNCSLEEVHLVSKDWFSFHLYCKEELTSICVEDILKRFLNLIDDDIQYSINFVQYYYDEYHIRFRIKILGTNDTDKIKVLMLMIKLFSSSIDDGLLTRYEMLPYRIDFSLLGGSDSAWNIEKILTLDSLYVISNYSILRTLPIQYYVLILQSIFESFGIDTEELIKHFKDIEVSKNYSLYRNVKKEIKNIDLDVFPFSKELFKKCKYLVGLSNEIESKRKVNTSEKIEIAKRYIHLFLNKIFFNKFYEEKIYQLFYLYLMDKKFTQKSKM